MNLKDHIKNHSTMNKIPNLQNQLFLSVPNTTIWSQKTNYRGRGGFVSFVFNIIALFPFDL